MSSGAKYIVVCLKGISIETPLVFPAFVEHADFMRRLGVERSQVISAGFVRFGVKNGEPIVSAYGESISLRVGSRGSDSLLLYRTLEIGDD